MTSGAPADRAGARAIPRPIEAHGVIGDQGTAALVADDGTVDFMCWPAFDSPTVFAALLDPERGGCWTLAPALDGARRRQMYLPDTNVLLTRFSSPDGVGEVVDFMPFPKPGPEPGAGAELGAARGGGPRLVRRVRAVRGRVRFRLRCAPRFDYARAAMVAEMIVERGVKPRAEPGVKPRAERGAGGGVVFRGEGAGQALVPGLVLSGSVPLRVEAGAAVAEFEVDAGETVDFVLHGEGEQAGVAPGEVERLFTACVAHWHGWVGRSSYKGRWREVVTRSALVLKLLTSSKHGSVVAAATFGLPEAPGGTRNWDYRATWIRDASFTVYAFIRLGYVDEATAFVRWVSERVGTCSSGEHLRIMYGIDGNAPLEEETLPQLRGYGGATPVRIGNAAFGQLQLDIFGELLDAVYLATKYGKAIPYEGWQHVIGVVDWVCAHWREPDHGIWEVRGGTAAFLHSRLMCWVAVDRAARLALKRSLPAPLAHWHGVRDEIHASIWAEFWDAERGHFVSVNGEPGVDAAMLMMPLVRFVAATDPRWLATLDEIGRRLVDDPLVYRYRGDDGLEGSEGAFTACSFWYAECLARAGRVAEARLVFEKMLGYANGLGLFSEEIGPSGEQLGNTPQALTHLALISAAFFLDRELSDGSGPTWRS